MLKKQQEITSQNLPVAFRGELMTEYPNYYIVSRCRKNDELYGKIHKALNDKKTVCGLTIDENWWILCPGDKEIDCKQCLKSATAVSPQLDRNRIKKQG